MWYNWRVYHFCECSVGHGRPEGLGLCQALLDLSLVHRLEDTPAGETTHVRQLHHWCINIWMECLQTRPMPFQMWESMFRQTLQVLLANDTQKSQSSDMPKWHCVLWCYIISRILSDWMSFLVDRQMGCWYVNYACSLYQQ